MKEFLVGWLILQLVGIGLAGGVLYRKCLEERDKEITFNSFITPVILPLVFFTDDALVCDK